MFLCFYLFLFFIGYQLFSSLRSPTSSKPNIFWKFELGNITSQTACMGLHYISMCNYNLWEIDEDTAGRIRHSYAHIKRSDIWIETDFTSCQLFSDYFLVEQVFTQLFKNYGHLDTNCSAKLNTSHWLANSVDQHGLYGDGNCLLSRQEKQAYNPSMW